MGQFGIKEVAVPFKGGALFRAKIPLRGIRGLMLKGLREDFRAKKTIGPLSCPFLGGRRGDFGKGQESPEGKALPPPRRTICLVVNPHGEN